MSRKKNYILGCLIVCSFAINCMDIKDDSSDLLDFFARPVAQDATKKGLIYRIEALSRICAKQCSDSMQLMFPSKNRCLFVCDNNIQLIRLNPCGEGAAKRYEEIPCFLRVPVWEDDYLFEGKLYSQNIKRCALNKAGSVLVAIDDKCLYLWKDIDKEPPFKAFWMNISHKMMNCMGVIRNLSVALSYSGDKAVVHIKKAGAENRFLVFRTEDGALLHNLQGCDDVPNLYMVGENIIATSCDRSCKQYKLDIFDSLESGQKQLFIFIDQHIKMGIEKAFFPVGSIWLKTYNSLPDYLKQWIAPHVIIGDLSGAGSGEIYY